MGFSLSEDKGGTGTTLLLIDVQNDFHPGGSLAIEAANADADRITQLIRSSRSKINHIVATLDSHHRLDIAHSGFWVSGDGDEIQHPDPFTIISSEDVASGKWRPHRHVKIINSNAADENNSVHLDPTIFDNYQQVVNTKGEIDPSKYALQYTKQLEKNGCFQLCIWPEHCLIGGPGHNIVKSVWDAMQEWSLYSGGQIHYVYKGQHPLTEMFSALRAEVPVSKSTSFDQTLFDKLKQSDRILVAGQALSHCVNYTMRDMVDSSTPEERSKICLLRDCSSSVPGFEAASDEFLQYLEKNGVATCKAEDVFEMI
eukprot:CAMPEP_0197823974 /NCGR_PEP_ID=MMETSP1437-20131217/1287_1 /TAXON_ID=49252 ORGANISM="Eucampia antarctica, Strain CCMP1452" /NCGR_SAMPLE_ID=MMETSP1437 /ASSEMBLY_ACC=CAM_ASM_001096 /LENGTH=312 /DNA_ID=CAMNT_0043423415 /DNA_START=47 /DNA_END=985 /DNA_ORIENTATION=-